MTQPWILKYAPKTLSDIKGQDTAIKQVKEFIENFSKATKKVLVLYGPSGSGKTALAYAASCAYDYEFVEVNAGDARNKSNIDAILGSALAQRSFFSAGKLILVDEAEGFSGTYDRGGIAQLVTLIKKTTYPIIVTCKDPFDKKFKALRKIAQLVELKTLGRADIVEQLKEISQKEGIHVEDSVLSGLAGRSQGDMRAAINDLQLLSSGTDSITLSSFEELTQRAKVRTIEEALSAILKGHGLDDVLGAFDEVEEDVDQRFLWLDYNMPKEYTKPTDLARAYGALSRADVYRGRIRKRQHWRFLVYINALLTAGIATSKDKAYGIPPHYTQSTRILRIWQINMSQAKKKSIAGKIALLTHTSTKRIMVDFPTYVQMWKSPEYQAWVTQAASLDKDEVAWMAKQIA